MKRISYTLTSTVQYDRPVHRQYFTLHITPRSTNAQQVCGVHTNIMPTDGYSVQQDFCGNMMCVGSANHAHTEFFYQTSGIVFSSYAKGECGSAARIYELPSSLTGSTEALDMFYQQTISVCLNYCEQSVLKRAVCMMQIVFHHMRYQKDSTENIQTAAQAFQKQSGCAQDYVHIFLSCLRMAGFSARFVTGFCCPDGEESTGIPPFFHFWAEVYDGNRWIGLDPTMNCTADDSYVALAVGRDYADCMMQRTAFSGAAKAVYNSTIATAAVS